MSYEQNKTSKHPIVTTISNKAADILHTAIHPLWEKSNSLPITAADLKLLSEIVGILKVVQQMADASDEFSTLSTEDLIKKVKNITKEMKNSSEE